MLELEQTEELLLSHQIVPMGPIPMARNPEGVYPYESFCETSRRPVLKKYRMVLMENDRIRVKICPDLGGRVCSIYLKGGNVETLFVPRVVRPVRILPRHSFVGGGIEVSFPISHAPVQIVPILYQIERDADRIYVSCGEREIRFGMHWTVEYSLGEADDFLSQRTVFYNPGHEPRPWMSWSNAGVPARPDTEFHFPDGSVLSHGREMRLIDWKSEGPRCQSDVRRMTGFFWKTPDCCAFGAFTPSLGAGLYHVADPAMMPGIKLWSDGIGRDERWVSQYTLNGEQCLEIQAGLLIDQSVKSVLQPGQRHHHGEFWIPSGAPRDIRRIPLPNPYLRDLDRVPRFAWAREEEVSCWLAVISAKDAGRASQLPKAPDIDDNRWAISGIAELGDALCWAAKETQGAERGRWLFHFGSWLAGRDRIDAALDALSRSHDDRAKALAGCLWMRDKKDPRAAAECFRAIQAEALALHPQVIVERDKALASIGPETLKERAKWLEAVSQLEDEWLAERRASLRIDSGDLQGAHDYLRNTRFQLMHQRYARTRMWRQIEKSLGLEPVEQPFWLGEDDLAEFGAYREYAED